MYVPMRTFCLHAAVADGVAAAQTAATDATQASTDYIGRRRILRASMQRPSLHGNRHAGGIRMTLAMSHHCASITLQLHSSCLDRRYQ